MSLPSRTPEYYHIRREVEFEALRQLILSYIFQVQTANAVCNVLTISQLASSVFHVDMLGTLGQSRD